MKPIFAAKINCGKFVDKGGRYWWEALLNLDGKTIAELSMPGLAVTKDDAKDDARRIAEILNADFEEAMT